MSMISFEESERLLGSGTPTFAVVHFPPSSKELQPSISEDYFDDWIEAMDFAIEEFHGLSFWQRKSHSV